MPFIRFVVLAGCCFGALMAGAADQSLLEQVAAGNLIQPVVGAFSWYDLSDTQTGQKLFMRQAIVGEKKVGLKNGYWLETEVVPKVGFPIVYKILLTGAATDPKNIHEVFMREGGNPPQKVDLGSGKTAMPTSGLKSDGAKSLGKEKVALQEGEVEAEHFVVGEGTDKTDVWVSAEVTPMGIVKMISADGEMVLRRHGKGGQDAESVLDRPVDLPGTTENTKVTVKVNNQTTGDAAKKNFSQKKAPE